MTMQIAFEGGDTTNGVDRNKADAIATKVARAARAKALATLHPQNGYSQELFADRAYAAAYEAAFLQSIVKQKTIRKYY